MGSDGAASPTSIWEYDGSSSPSTSTPSAAAKALRPPFRLAPPEIIAEADRIEEYDADLGRNSGGGDVAKEEEEEEVAPACFSEEWVRKRKRKWKMQRAIREVRARIYLSRMRALVVSRLFGPGRLFYPVLTPCNPSLSLYNALL